MAVERPDTGVILIPLHNEIARGAGAAGRHHLDVAALRVAGADDAAVPLADAELQDLHVVAVEVDRVRGFVVVVDDDADGGVCAEVVDVARLVEGHLVGLYVAEDGYVVVVAEGGVVDLVQHICAVGGQCDVELLGGGRVGRRDWIDWDRGGEWVVGTGGEGG